MSIIELGALGEFVGSIGEGCADHALNEDDRTRFIHLVRELVYGCNAAFSVAIAAGNEDEVTRFYRRGRQGNQEAHRPIATPG